jgi:aspartate/methionine/tyrosine aminotransferase
MIQDTIRSSHRTGSVEHAIRDVNVWGEGEELKRSGKKVIVLNNGDPVKYGFDTPSHIKQAMKKAIDDGLNYYSASEGLKELRDAVAEKENVVSHARIEARDILITQGVSEAIFFLMGAIVDPGDQVLMPGPCYSPYVTYTKFFDGTPVMYRTIEERGWGPDLDDLEGKINEKTRLIVLVNPNNPTGSVYSKLELSKILEIAASHNLPVATDETYDRIVYDKEFTSVASVAKETPILGLNGFSKAYLMTGWRLGYIYIQDPRGQLRHVWEGIQKMSRVRLCACTPTQMAGIEALTGPQVHIAGMVAKLKRRRDFVVKRIMDIPRLSVTVPSGAFYVFPKIDLHGTKWSSDRQFVMELVKETGVLVVYGSGFDAEYGRDHFRSVFLPDESVLSEAFDAIEGFMKRHSQ